MALTRKKVSKKKTKKRKKNPGKLGRDSLYYSAEELPSGDLPEKINQIAELMIESANRTEQPWVYLSEGALDEAIGFQFPGSDLKVISGKDDKNHPIYAIGAPATRSFIIRYDEQDDEWTMTEQGVQTPITYENALIMAKSYFQQPNPQNKKVAKRKVTKRKAAKRNAAKKKATKRKTAKRKTKKKPSVRKVGKLKAVPKKDYEIVWDARRESCHFGHKKGIGGEIGSGVNDVIEVYTDSKMYYVLSLNYTEGYSCIEAFDGEPGGCAFLCFALPEDIDEMMGVPLEQIKPSDVISVMLEQTEFELED